MKKSISGVMLLFSLVMVVLITAFNVMAIAVPVYEGVYIPGYGGLYVVDGETETYEGLIANPMSFGRKSIVINQATNIAYVTDFRTTTTAGDFHFFAIDLVSGNVVKKLDITDGVAVVPNVALNTDTNKLYLSSTAFNSVLEIDASDYSIRKILDLGIPGSTDPIVGQVCVNESDNLVYVGVGITSLGRVDCINPVTGTVISTAPGAIGNDPSGICYDDVNGYVYVSCAGGAFYILDATTLNVVSSITFPPRPTNPPILWGISYNHLTNTIYVADYRYDLLYPISITNSGGGDVFTPLTPISVGSGPRFMAIDYETNRIYVNGYIDDVVTIVDGATNTVIDTVDLVYNAAPGAVAIYYPTRVTFMNNDGSTSVFSRVLIGNNLAVSEPSGSPSNAGFEFVGWFESPVALNPNPSLTFNFSTVLHDDKVLYAGWKEPDVTLIYNPNGGTNTHTISSITVRDVLTVLDVSATGIVRSGFGFVSWNTQANGSGTEYLPGDPIAMNTSMTLYAQWVPLNTPNTGAESVMPLVGLMLLSSFVVVNARKRKKDD